MQFYYDSKNCFICNTFFAVKLLSSSRVVVDFLGSRGRFTDFLRFMSVDSMLG
jgi:hypothetical protein